MTQDEIVTMARKAGLVRAGDKWVEPARWGVTEVERFAALVAAAERNILAAWMIQRSYATGHGDTIEDLLKELEWQIAENWTNALVKGVEGEREACAKVCDELAARDKLSNYYAVAAKAIRARGNT